MSKSTKTPRCECCDEVMDELLTIRQTFEKMFHKLTKQIIELRREVTDAMINKTQEKPPTSERYSSSPNPTEPPTKVPRINRDESITKNLALKINKNTKIPKNVPDNTDSEPKASERVPQINQLERPLLQLYNIQARVLPTHPFDTAQQFEDWHAKLSADKGMCDKLRAELLQGHLIEPELHIRTIWRRIFKNEAADCYAYRGNGRSKKRPIKSYLFTKIFQECFLQRFRGMDDVFFIERTMRFFHNVHGQMRKSLRDKQKLRDVNEPRVQNEALTDDEIEIKDVREYSNDNEDSII
ncbi:unnamed protein product [Ceratitis capitata]|uniref:(Mediterranean fruit fly) hypothetical protein n=2 Tax=Ceratitis capitata TaxID=7213 RepID=W8BG61_CERCA|nr:unnamed protein product [Ceratitis capitata]